MENSVLTDGILFGMIGITKSKGAEPFGVRRFFLFTERWSYYENEKEEINFYEFGIVDGDVIITHRLRFFRAGRFLFRFHSE